MRAHSPTRSLGTLFTGVPHSASATIGDTISILVRDDKSGYLSCVIIDARDTTIGTFASAVDLGRPTLQHAGDLLRNTIWAWRQGLRMAGLDLEISAFDTAGRRLVRLENLLRAETKEEKAALRREIARLQSVNLQLVSVTPS